MVTMEPVGVAGLITAWNANTLFVCLKLASAVTAGCTVVIKPSELSSIQTQVLVEALHKANLPKGLLNVVTRRGNVVGADWCAILMSPRSRLPDRSVVANRSCATVRKP
jgi:aldehyde dehydrogenase (NAD+)